MSYDVCGVYGVYDVCGVYGVIWRYMALYGVYGVYGVIWRYMALYGVIWRIWQTQRHVLSCFSYV